MLFDSGANLLVGASFLTLLFSDIQRQVVEVANDSKLQNAM